MTRLVLAISAENAEAILDGSRTTDHRTRPPKRLPARAYLAVPGIGIVGECELGEPERKTDDGWALPVSNVKRYARPRSLDRFGSAKTPRSFVYLD
jgi:predicted transcriptional regulator